MSDTSSLSELARFVGRSALNSEDPQARRRTTQAIAARLNPQPRRTVSELLGAVLVLSARTRRMVLPPAVIDLDVFGPDGVRAARVRLPQAG
jgi:hypothetical protein